MAWSVCAPADKRRSDNDGRVGELPPKQMPKSSKVVVADERGGGTRSVDLGRHWMSQLRMLRGPGRPTEPQFALRSCSSRSEKRCEDELLTLTAEPPLKVIRRAGGAQATAAIEGHLDSGRRLIAASRPD